MAPERLRGMVIEMPVLDNALLGCALAFTPLMVALTLRRAGDAARWRAPRGWCPRAPLPWQADVVLDCGAPGPGAERRGAPGPVLRPHRAAARASAARSRRRRW